VTRVGLTRAAGFARASALAAAQARPNGAYWSEPITLLLERLRTSPDGLGASVAAQRLSETGNNELVTSRRLSRLRALVDQIRSPLPLLLVFAAAVSLGTSQWVDAGVVLTIVIVTVAIGYRREYHAQVALSKLQERIALTSQVLRGGAMVTVRREAIVPGDVVLLAAGSLVPADGVLLEATDCYVNEAVLTGESYPVKKQPGTSEVGATLRQRSNCVFLGSNVRSGTARCLVVATGRATEFGAVAERIESRPPMTEFDRGVRRFGYLLTAAMAVLVLLVFVAHVLQGRPPVETLLFSVALAVGLTPELLPAILGVNLARGAERLAGRKVLVRRLNAIENLGSMDVLCTDKTGTLTDGVIDVEGAYDLNGERSDSVLELAAINAALETGLPSPLDDAIAKAHTPDLCQLRKRSEVPFDFMRKRVSVVVQDARGIRIITKGAFHHIVEICDRTLDGSPLTVERRAELERRHQRWGREGIRVLAVATAPMPEKSAYGTDDERALAFAGFVAFLDRPKAGVREAVTALGQLGVAVKVITGDVRPVAEHVAGMVGLNADHVLTGADLDAMSDEALSHSAEQTDLFVEVDPNQKERIILALKKRRHVVGFLGDGVNDAPAMHAADTSLSVQEAVDVAREAADFVLLDRHLEVIRGGIEEGRTTFANTLKYVLTTMSANLGNMASMAATSLFLPFLPLTAGQILLNNFLADVPAVGLATDTVDPELVAQPRRWDLRFITRFTLEFGALSSVFDFITFGVLLRWFHAGPALFQTGWFVESLLTELLVALVVRTRRPFMRSRPGRILVWSTAILVPIALAIPYLPHANVVGFVPIPGRVLGALIGITLAYAAATELMKRRFYRGAA
jgi:Mg2+-importing ATPase